MDAQRYDRTRRVGQGLPCLSGVEGSPTGRPSPGLSEVEGSGLRGADGLGLSDVECRSAEYGGPTRPPYSSPLGARFSSYYLGGTYDEMFEPSGQARQYRRALYEDLLATSLPELCQYETEAERAFLTQGITFTVYGDDQTVPFSAFLF
jgi:hypothetical protein